MLAPTTNPRLPFSLPPTLLISKMNMNSPPSPPPRDTAGASADSVDFIAASSDVIHLKHLSQSMRKTLAPLDVDHDGSITTSELVAAVNSHLKTKATNTRLTRVVIGSFVFLLLLLGVVFGLAFAAIQAVIKANTTMQSMTTALTDMNGATLRTAGGAISAATAAYSSVSSRRQLHETAAGRALSKSINFVNAEGDDLVHFRRPVGVVGAQWDKHGRSLAAVHPNKVNYVTIGTTSSAAAVQLCTYVTEGQSNIAVSLLLIFSFSL